MNNIYFESCHFDWMIFEGGDFRGRYRYHLKNNSNNILPVLPKNSILKWKNVEISELYVRIIGSGQRRIFGFKANGHSIRDSISEFFKDAIKEIDWGGEISPPLLPGEDISYETYISTIASDESAFDESGSIMGIPSVLPIREATVKYRAPGRYKFDIISDPFFVNMHGMRVDIPSEFYIALSSEFEFIEDENAIVWRVRNLPSGYRLWVRYRLVRN